MAGTLTVTDLVTSLTDILDRVRDGERFLIERDGEVVATIAPPSRLPGITERELAARLGDLMPPGDGFGDDLEAIQAAQPPASAPERPD